MMLRSTIKPGRTLALRHKRSTYVIEKLNQETIQAIMQEINGAGPDE